MLFVQQFLNRNKDNVIETKYKTFDLSPQYPFKSSKAAHSNKT